MSSHCSYTKISAADFRICKIYYIGSKKKNKNQKSKKKKHSLCKPKCLRCYSYCNHPFIDINTLFRTFRHRKYIYNWRAWSSVNVKTWWTSLNWEFNGMVLNTSFATREHYGIIQYVNHGLLLMRNFLSACSHTRKLPCWDILYTLQDDISHLPQVLKCQSFLCVLPYTLSLSRTEQVHFGMQ